MLAANTAKVEVSGQRRQDELLCDPVVSESASDLAIPTLGASIVDLSWGLRLGLILGRMILRG